jgi:hypothetical protein
VYLIRKSNLLPILNYLELPSTAEDVSLFDVSLSQIAFLISLTFIVTTSFKSVFNGTSLLYLRAESLTKILPFGYPIVIIFGYKSNYFFGNFIANLIRPSFAQFAYLSRRS